MAKTVKIINPGGELIEAREDENGVEKARKGIDGWSLPKDKGADKAPKSGGKGKADA